MTLLRDAPASATDHRVRRRPRYRPTAAWLAGGLGAVVALGWLGLRITPSPLPPVTLASGDVATTSLPDDLPAPVARFYERLYGDEVPVVESAVVSGRGTMRIAGVTFPARFRFSHIAGQDYRHYIELTVFGQPVMRVDEWFLDGRGRLDLPMGTSEGPQVDQGANLALWAEAVWMPSVWITDPDATWEPIDDHTARLTVPFGAERESFTAAFDPDSGLLARMESMRFKGEADEARTPWINEAFDWGEVGTAVVPLRTTVAWGDEDSPWARLRTEEVLYNAPLDAHVRQSGP